MDANLNRFDELTQAQAWLLALRPLPAAVVEELRHRYEVRFTYNSTAIEGNSLTQSETQIILEKGVAIAGKSLAEHLEVIGHKEALDFVVELADAKDPIGEREIREIHSLVMKGQGHRDSGAYRMLDVRAAGTEFVYPSHLHLSELMSEFGKWLAEPTETHPVEFASEAHLRFVTMHPFRDGNGRVGRLLMNLLLIRAGYPIAVLPVSRRSEYIDALESAQSGQGRAALDAIIANAVFASLRDTLAAAVSADEVRFAHPTIVQQVEPWIA